MSSRVYPKLRLVAALLMLESHALARSSKRDDDGLGFPVPDFAKLQSGGFAGAVALGLGYAALDDVLNAGVFYGYVPPARGRSVQSLHFVLSLRPGEAQFAAARWLPLYAGFGALCTWGPGYFVTPPARYPAGYYYPTALRLTAHIGSELDWLSERGAFERHGFFVELTTLDIFLFAYVENPHLVDLNDIVSTSLGYRAAF